MFPALLAAVLVAAAALALVLPSSTRSHLGGTDPWTPSPRPEGKTVALEIDYGNGARRVYGALPWREGMTVADLMIQAREFRPGVEFSQMGSGAGGFLTALDGLKNQGASGRNWRYQVDGRNGDVSFCLQGLAPEARVLWEFTDEQ